MPASNAPCVLNGQETSIDAPDSKPDQRDCGRRWTLTPVILGACLLLFCVARAEAASITWHWAGLVTGYACEFACDPTIDTAVPLGTPVDVSVSFEDGFPTHPDPVSRCLLGRGTATLQVLGRTYTGLGVAWDEAFGFGPGLCVPGFQEAEIVVPSWGVTGLGPNGPALPEGWAPVTPPGPGYFPGLWWAGDFTSVQPASINSQFPFFTQCPTCSRERFTANLEAIPAPEPSTLLLLGTGLAAVWRRRGVNSRLPR